MEQEVARYVQETQGLLEDVRHEGDGRVSAVTDMAHTDKDAPWLHGHQVAAPIFALLGKVLDPEEEVSKVNRLSFSQPVYSNLRLTAARTELDRSAAPVSAQFETTKGSSIFVSSVPVGGLIQKDQSVARHPLFPRLRLGPSGVYLLGNSLAYVHHQEPMDPVLSSGFPGPHFHLKLWYQAVTHIGFYAAQHALPDEGQMMVSSLVDFVPPKVEAIREGWSFLSFLVSEGRTRSGFPLVTAGVACGQEGSKKPTGSVLVSYVAVPKDYR